MKLSPEQEENRKEALDEFFELYEYPMGDIFLFTLFDDNEDGINVSITPLSYWEKEQCQYDGDLIDIIDLPEGFDEIDECVYTYDGDIKGAISKLVAAGFKFNNNFHKFMKQHLDEETLIDGKSIEQYIEKNYQDCIVA